MSAEVIQIASDARVNEAWDAYAAEAVKLADDPALLINRAFNENLARLHRAWLRLFNMQDVGR